MLNSFTQPFVHRFQQWASNRRPKGKLIELNQKRIFIFPTAAGWAFLSLCLVMLLVAMNYQNNLIYAVAFLLISMGVMTIHYTFLNLSGLRVKVVKGYNCYSGDMADFLLLVDSVSKRSYEGVQLGWKGQPEEQVNLDSNQTQNVHLNARTGIRGRFSPGILKIETRYPFGLLRAWSWLEPEIEILVYPKPCKGRQPVFTGREGEGDHPGTDDSGDDFSGLDEYQPGASTKRIAWKQYAQGRGLFTKSYVGNRDRRLWLNWELWPELSGEQRLSVICYWAQQFEHQGVEYGLSLPDFVLSPDRGPAHLEQVLIALAKFPSSHSNGERS